MPIGLEDVRERRMDIPGQFASGPIPETAISTLTPVRKEKKTRLDDVPLQAPKSDIIVSQTGEVTEQPTRGSLGDVATTSDLNAGGNIINAPTVQALSDSVDRVPTSIPRDERIDEMGALIPKGIDTTSPGGDFQQHEIRPSEAGDADAGIVRSVDEEGNPVISFTKDQGATRTYGPRGGRVIGSGGRNQTFGLGDVDKGSGSFGEIFAENLRRKRALSDAKTAGALASSRPSAKDVVDLQRAKVGLKSEQIDLDRKQNINSLYSQYEQAQNPEDREAIVRKILAAQGKVESSKLSLEKWMEADRGYRAAHAKLVAEQGIEAIGDYYSYIARNKEANELLYGKKKPPSVKTQAEYDKLKSGEVYINEDGERRRKP